MSTELQTIPLTVEQRAVVALGFSEAKEKELRDLAASTADITVITNADGRAQVHTARMRLKNERLDIKKLAEEKRDDANKFQKAVIALEKRLVGIVSGEEDRLQTVQDAWDAKIEAEKQALVDAELKRVADLQARVVYLNGNPTLTSLTDPDLIAEHISDLQAEIVDESFEEYRERADAAKATGIARLQALHAAAVERVAEAERVKAERAELAALRAEQAERDRVEREQRDAETARQAAELKALREKQEAEAAAERKRIADEAAAAKAVRDEELRVQRVEQARIDAELKAQREAQEAEAAAERKRLADERAEFERQQAEARAAAAAEEAKRAEQARIAALIRPSDDEMIDVLAIHYNAPADRVVSWILQMDLSSRAAA